MSRKVLIVSSSLRANSNSELLAREAERGARDAGHEVEFVSLKDKDIRFCKGWIACFPESHFAGVYSGGGLNDGNEAKAHPELMDGAYQFGKSL